ncbi:MAG TPA: nicotinate-nucleotide diphosphorylase (carboxylating), partial [Ghiorsea sp.]|nr:nicotinate-nucleotide diphosphorylase (carboxylating) [Ghiorsea sp.]
MTDLLLQPLIDTALAEDMAWYDLTAKATISQDQLGKASIIAKQNGVLSGCNIAKQVFETMDESVQQT